MRGLALWLMLCAPALAEIDVTPLRSDLAAIYETRKADAQLKLTFDPVLPYVILPGPVEVFKSPDGYRAFDASGHRPALCTVKYTMMMRALAQTCRGLARPDQVRVMDTVIDSHIGFVAANSMPPRDVADVRLTMSLMLSDAYMEYKNPLACADRTIMIYFTTYLEEIDRGEVKERVEKSLAAPRLPVEHSCS